MSLATALEHAAEDIQSLAEGIRPANGDPIRLLENLDKSGAVQVLTWLFEREPQYGVELVEAWLGDSRGCQVVLAVDEGSLSKSGRKILRRALHSLRSRGVVLPMKERAVRVASLPPVDDEFRAAAVTSIDPSGARIVYLVDPDPRGGSRLFEITVSAWRGIMGVKIYSAGRSKVRSFLRQLTMKSGLPGAEVPLTAARALMERALALQRPDFPVPREFVDWRAQLLPEGVYECSPGDEVRAALGDEIEAGVERALELAKAGEVGPWLPERSVIESLAAKLQEKTEGLVLLSPTQQKEQAELVLVEELEQIYGGEGAGRIAGLYREQAYVCWKAGNLETAKECLAAALAFEEWEPVRNPLARYFLETPLMAMMPNPDDANERSSDSLLVKP